MTGEECPGRTLTFQATFLSAPNSAGTFGSFEIPDPFGPRKRGQSSATIVDQEWNDIANANQQVLVTAIKPTTESFALACFGRSTL